MLPFLLCRSTSSSHCVSGTSTSLPHSYFCCFPILSNHCSHSVCLHSQLVLESKSPTSTTSPCLLYFCTYIYSYLSEVPLYLVYILSYSSTLGAYRCSLRSNGSAPRSPGILIHMFSSNLVSFIASIMSHREALTRNPTLPAPLFLLFILSLPLLSCPCVLSNFAYYFPPPLSPMTLEFPRCLGLAYFCSAILIIFRSSVANPYSFHEILFSASFSFHYPL